MQKNLTKLLFVLIGLCAFVLGMKQLREPDIWWQLLSGRWMIEHGAITHKDVFSFTMAGKPWINVKWLYEIFIALIEKALGPEGVLLLQALINVVIIWLLYRTLSAFGKYANKVYSLFATVIALLLFLAINEYRMAGRPEMISHLMCTLFLYILWRNPGFEWKKIWWLIPLQCIWANMHEGYPVGIVIIGTFAVGGFISYLLTKEKQALQYTIRASLVLVGCVAVILINPNGIVLWKQPFEIYRQVWANKYTTELFSYKDPQYWTIEAKWHLALLVAVSAYWVMQIVQAVKQKQTKVFFTPIIVSYLLLIPMFAYLSLTANRNIPFSEIVLFPSIPVMILWLWQLSRVEKIGVSKVIAKQALPIAIIVTLLFYVSVVTNKFYKYTNSPNRYGIHVSMLHNPTGAAAFMKQYNIKGTGFSDYFISSYLLWALYPEFKSYIDLRDLDVFPVKFFDDYFKIYQNPEKFGELDKKFDFNYVVISTSQLKALQMNLYWGEGYNLIYLDPVSAIFLKQNETNASLNGNFELQKMYNWPAAIEDPSWAEGITKLLNPTVAYTDEDDSRQAINAARYYNMIKNFSAAIKMLLPQLPSYEDDAEAYGTMGSTYLQYAEVLKDPIEKKQKLDSANAFLEQAKSIDPNNPTTLSSLAMLNIVQGDYKTGAEHLEEYLKTSTEDDYMYFLYGFCNRMAWKSSNNTEYAEKVIPAMKNALKLNPNNGKALLYMSEAYRVTGDNEKARESLKEAIASGNTWLKEEQILLDELKTQLGVK